MNRPGVVNASPPYNATDEGVVFSWADPQSEIAPPGPGELDDTAALLEQLVEDDYMSRVPAGYYLSWDRLYDLSSSADYAESLRQLCLPQVRAWRPVLRSSGALSDADFSITLSGWVDAESRGLETNSLKGAFLSTGNVTGVIPRAAWRVVQGVRAFHARPTHDRTQDQHQRYWAQIRRDALEAKAELSNFLRNTIVLTPDRLTLTLRRGDIAETKLLEIVPSFAEAPAQWLSIFDRASSVRERYDVPDAAGLTIVLPSPEVREVLAEIKRFPGRRLAGERAEAFVRNPFSLLGPAASAVIDPAEFEAARTSAGLTYTQFSIAVDRDADEHVIGVRLLVQENSDGIASCDVSPFESPATLWLFVDKLERRLNQHAECFVFAGYELELLGDAVDQLALAKEAYQEWSRPRKLAPSEIFDLESYSKRVAGFGIEQPYYSPFIAKKAKEVGWFPNNVSYGISFVSPTSEERVALELSGNLKEKFLEAVSSALSSGKDSLTFPGCPKPIPISEARVIADCFADASANISEGGAQMPKGLPKVPRLSPLLKPNIEAVDYEERRGSLSLPKTATARLPASLKRTFELKAHQLQGLTWFQYLWQHSPKECRGALLADDMGVGKTIQVLAFIASCLEADSSLDPVLIVAPLSLLENWEAEATKFFQRDSLPILRLYGGALRQRMIPRVELPEDALAHGIARLLDPKWRGNSRVILTTYETLRDLEFSLARQQWSIMVCDEAQWIKNPNALWTRAAKKQKARFKIACTGTPVENSLADLWSLFDFIQPGLLGSLNQFGTEYRKPIEAKTPEERARLEELRKVIEPQTLRRLKADVARDLPRKIEDAACRTLELSQYQRLLYAEALEQRRRDAEISRRPAAALRWLQRIRSICSDPTPVGALSTAFASTADLENKSPKIAWLGRTLLDVQARAEKAIVFCESRELQRTIQKYLTHRFGVVPDIINGDTSATAGNPNGRAARIARFQRTPGFTAIVLSPLATGVGLNIQAANHVIHFTRHWNPAKEDQATDRAYRIGQERDVYVYYPTVTAEFETFDAVLDRLLTRKRGLSNDMLNGASDLTVADFRDAIDAGLSADDNVTSKTRLSGQDLATLDPTGLEALCAILWERRGYVVYRTPPSNDGGVDVVAIRAGDGALLQCKLSKMEGASLGWDAVKEVAAGAAAYHERHPNVQFRKIAVTNSRFNETAKKQAALNGVTLWDGDELGKALAETPLYWSDIQEALWLQG